MSLFKETASAAAQSAATAPQQEQSAGLDLHLPYRPTDKVWTLTDGIKAVELRVIKITTEHRSLIGTSYQPHTRVTVMLENGLERDGSEVFMSKDELIQSL